MLLEFPALKFLVPPKERCVYAADLTRHGFRRRLNANAPEHVRHTHSILIDVGQPPLLEVIFEEVLYRKDRHLPFRFIAFLDDLCFRPFLSSPNSEHKNCVIRRVRSIGFFAQISLLP